MNIEKIRKQFRFYREQISTLEEALEESNYYHEESISRANQKAQQAESARYDAERDFQTKCSQKQWDRDRAVGDLNRARAYGDDYGVERALRRLKNL